MNNLPVWHPLLQLFIGPRRLFSRLIMLMLSTLIIAGCGFHLRGMIDVPQWLNNVAIIVQQVNHDLEPLLKNQLQAYNIHVNADPASANYWLILEHDSIVQNISSISSSTTPRQYQLTYTVQFKLQQARGKEIIPSTTIVITRQSTINSDRILGSNDEEELQKNEMRRDAVIQIINRLSRRSPEIGKSTPHNALPLN